MPVSRSNGVDIWYEVKGDGPAIVLVHANPFDHDLWLDHSLPAGKTTASLTPGAVHKVLTGTGHACCLEVPAGFDRLVIDFLQARKLMPGLRG